MVGDVGNDAHSDCSYRCDGDACAVLDSGGYVYGESCGDGAGAGDKMVVIMMEGVMVMVAVMVTVVVTQASQLKNNNALPSKHSYHSSFVFQNSIHASVRTEHIYPSK